MKLTLSLGVFWYRVLPGNVGILHPFRGYPRWYGYITFTRTSTYPWTSFAWLHPILYLLDLVNTVGATSGSELPPRDLPKVRHKLALRILFRFPEASLYSDWRWRERSTSDYETPAGCILSPHMIPDVSIPFSSIIFSLPVIRHDVVLWTLYYQYCLTQTSVLLPVYQRYRLWTGIIRLDSLSRNLL